MEFKELTLEEMRNLYHAKVDQMENLIDGYWGGAPEELEGEPSVKDQIRQLGQEIQELERLMSLRKTEIQEQPFNPNFPPD